MKRSCLIPILVFLLLLVGFVYLMNNLVGVMGFDIRLYVSESVQESKNNKAFIRECRIDDIIVFNESYQFPFKQSWEEEVCFMDFDKKKSFIVVDTLGKSRNIVFKFSSKKDYNLFCEGNIDKRWIMWGDYISNMGIVNGMCITHLSEKYFDSIKLSFTIYKQNTYSMKENLTPLFKFNLYRDAPDERDSTDIDEELKRK